MDYKKTVEKVMALLKRKEVCASSRKSHDECYKSLEDFMSRECAPFSPQLNTAG